MFQDIQAVLFDLDGTLIDSAPDLGAAADTMRIKRGLPSKPAQEYRPFAGAGARGMLQVAFDITPEHLDFEKMREEFFTNYENCMYNQTYIFDGVAELIEQITKKGLLWGVVTNKIARFTNPLTRSISLFDSAKAIISGDTTPFFKPHPEPLFEAARRLKVSPSACLYVGDDERDIVAGRAAGMKTVAASYGYLAEKNTNNWNAHAEIKSPSELLQWLML